MIKAGNFTIDDKGFAVSVERMGGVAREVLVLELGGGIPDEAMEAICTGPIEVLGENGETVKTHTGPFRIASHSMRLTRASEEGDVAALTARVNSLEAELSETKNAKDSALESLASLNEKFSALKEQIASVSTGSGGLLGELGGIGDKVTTPIKKETTDEAGSVQE